MYTYALLMCREDSRSNAQICSTAVGSKCRGGHVADVRGQQAATSVDRAGDAATTTAEPRQRGRASGLQVTQ